MQRIESRDNPYVKHLYKLGNDKSYRVEAKKVLIEGKELINEFLPHLSGTVFSQIAIDLEKFPKMQQVAISSAIARKISAFADEEAQFAEVIEPELKFPKKCRRILALDGVADPGNLGTLLRSALSLGWDGVFLLPKCTDPFNSKVIRASKGALFKLPCGQGDWKDLEALAKEHELEIVAADLQGQKPEDFKTGRYLLILGNEGQGLSSASHSLASKTISIPKRGAMESLNVAAAGAILMYLLGESWQI